MPIVLRAASALADIHSRGLPVIEPSLHAYEVGFAKRTSSQFKHAIHENDARRVNLPGDDHHRS